MEPKKMNKKSKAANLKPDKTIKTKPVKKAKPDVKKTKAKKSGKKK